MQNHHQQQQHHNQHHHHLIGVQNSKPVTPSLSEGELHLDKPGECFIDKDERDEEGENLLCERGYISNQEAALCSHDDQNNEDEPKPDPDSGSQILKSVSPTKLVEEQRGMKIRKCGLLFERAIFTKDLIKLLWLKESSQQ